MRLIVRVATCIYLPVIFYYLQSFAKVGGSNLCRRRAPAAGGAGGAASSSCCAAVLVVHHPAHDDTAKGVRMGSST
jgi:hypothetical protein